MSDSENDFKLKFDGDFHEIDADVLVTNLLQTTAIIQDVKSRLGAEERIRIKVKALEQGSFLVHLELLEPTNFNLLKSIFSGENLQYVVNLMLIVGGLYKFHKFLKGKKAKNIEERDNTVVITNFNGDELEIDKKILDIYRGSPVIRAALEKSFDNLESNEAITGFEITDKDEKPLVRIEREEFGSLGSGTTEIFENERQATERTRLTIIRASFDSKLKWDFYYRGIKIAAKVDDPDYNELVDKGEAFAKGDVFDATMEILQQFDESVNTFFNKSYKVVKVHTHIRRENINGKQSSFFDENNKK